MKLKDNSRSVELSKFLADAKDSNLHIDNIECNGCKKEFCVTLRSDPDDASSVLCGTCYGSYNTGYLNSETSN